MKSEWKKEKCWTIRGAAAKASIKQDVMLYLIESGKVASENGLVQKEDVLKIIKNRQEFISFSEYVKGKANDRFVPTLVRNRNALWDYMEENNFFGIKMYSAKDMLFTLPDNSDKFMRMEDIEIMDKGITMFLRLYDLEVIDQVKIVLGEKVKSKILSDTYLEFVEEIKKNEPRYYTKILVNLANDIGTYEEDILNDRTEKMKQLINGVDYKREELMFVKYMALLKRKGVTKVNNILFEDPKDKEKRGRDAYDVDTYAKIAKLIFNEEMIQKNKLIEKALNKSFFAEMWMFWACFFVDGWRGNDTCEKWVYLRLDENSFIDEFCIDTLADDILMNRICEEQYEKVARYCLKVYELELQNTLKIGENTKGFLLPAIREENLAFYGRLELIAESHHLKNGEGYMKCNRMEKYLNKYKIKEFFGNSFYETLYKGNGEIRRMNKSFLQSFEVVSRKEGHTPLAAQTLVSLARNHSNLDSIQAYLSDHSIDGECADVVLSMLIERGVMGVYIYQALKESFPEAFKKMPAVEQTKMMSLIKITPLDIEMGSNTLLLQEKIESLFVRGKNEEKIIGLLRALYEIGNGNGMGKDKGIYCLRRALGEICENGKFASCIANDCPYLIFTKYGIDSLIGVIRSFFAKYEESHNIKYIEVLKQVILPKYKYIIIEIMRSFKTDEQKIMMEYLEKANG